MRHTYFNVYILPLGLSGIAINFLAAEIFKGALCFYAAVSVQSVSFGIKCHLYLLTPEKRICGTYEGKKSRSKWRDVSGPAVSFFTFSFFLLFLKFKKETSLGIFMTAE